MKSYKELMEAKDKGFKVGDKVKIKTSGLTRATERGFKKFLGKSGTIVKDYGDGDMKVNLGGNNDISINSKDLVKEELMEAKFSPEMVDQLRKGYGGLKTMSYKNAEKLKKMVEKMPKKFLQQLAKEDIEWVSMFAHLKLSKLERGE